MSTENSRENEEVEHSNALPGWFNANNGDGWQAGFHLAAYHLPNVLDDNWADDPEELAHAWSEELRELLEKEAGDAELMDWMRRRLPRCAEAIPEDEIPAFCRGIRDAWHRGEFQGA